MKRFLTLGAFAMTLAAPGVAVHAQTATQPPGAPAATQESPSGAATAPAKAGAVTQQGPNEVLAETVIGMSVRNTQDESIGKIGDLVLDDKGQVKAALVSVGGFLGIGDKKIAVPWDQIRFDADKKVAMLNMNKEQLAQAPEFKTREQAQREAERAQRASQPAGAPTRPSQSGAPATAPVR